MTTRTRARVLAFIIVAALVYAAGTAYARTLTHIQRVPLSYVHTAIVVCDGWAEDTAAHIRLRTYDDGVAVYVCERHGY